MVKTKSTYQHGKVSIIIPIFNRASLLPETLDAILAQTYINWECILVDDGSNDDTLVVAKEYTQKDSRFRVYSRPSNIQKGANGCRNYGFSLSEGEFIQWFDSDDIMEEHLLNFRVKQMVNSSVDLVVSPAKYFNQISEIPHVNGFREIKFEENGKAFQFLAGNSWFQTSQCLVRKRFISDNILPFNTILPRNQETELFVRWLLKNPSIQVNNDGPFVFIRQHEDSISGNYSSAAIGQKIQIDIPAYRMMYQSFKRSNQMTTEVNDYFKDFFYKSIRQMRPASLEFFRTFYFSWKNRLLPSEKKVFRLLIYRILGVC